MKYNDDDAGTSRMCEDCFDKLQESADLERDSKK